jgi:hypothetical protein
MCRPVNFVNVAELVAAARDEDGMPILAIEVHNMIAAACKHGCPAMGRPCDEAGMPGDPIEIPAGDWYRKRFPLVSRHHEHDTFWNQSGRLAYVDIRLSVEGLLAYWRDLAPKQTPQGGRPPKVKDAVTAWFQALTPNDRARSARNLAGQYLGPGSPRRIREIIGDLKKATPKMG